MLFTVDGSLFHTIPRFAYPYTKLRSISKSVEYIIVNGYSKSVKKLYLSDFPHLRYIEFLEFSMSDCYKLTIINNPLLESIIIHDFVMSRCYYQASVLIHDCPQLKTILLTDYALKDVDNLELSSISSL